MKRSDAISDVGVVVIGRDEGKRFVRCLKSLEDWMTDLVYVDSGSTDGSVKEARKAGAVVIQLDPTIPFTAARARNEGIEALIERGTFTYVQFVDGDCEVDPLWIVAARQYLVEHQDVAVVGGRLQERFPERSVYNRLCAIEWNTPLGEVQAIGGIALYRIDEFLAVGRFDPSLIAGEEPELCMRIRQNGMKVIRLETLMARHDANIITFRQWWLRTQRAGYGCLDVVTRLSGQIPSAEIPFYLMVRSVRTWTIYWVASTLFLALAGSVFFRSFGMVLGLVTGICIWLVQVIRISWGVRKRTQEFKDAMAYGFLTLLGKWAQLLGQYNYRRTHCDGK